MKGGRCFLLAFARTMRVQLTSLHRQTDSHKSCQDCYRAKHQGAGNPDCRVHHQKMADGNTQLPLRRVSACPGNETYLPKDIPWLQAQASVARSLQAAQRSVSNQTRRGTRSASLVHLRCFAGVSPMLIGSTWEIHR